MDVVVGTAVVVLTVVVGVTVVFTVVGAVVVGVTVVFTVVGADPLALPGQTVGKAVGSEAVFHVAVVG